MSGVQDVHRTVEEVVRDSYSRLVAYAAVRSRDVTIAEDALSDAFLAALETWPHIGVPKKPEAWLLAVARRKMIDGARRDRAFTESAPALLAIMEETAERATDDAFPDERLKLLFACAHPAIDRAAHAPLMLQVVLGLDAARIASAFVTRPTSMGQRLTRAKRKIRDARIALELPDAEDLPGRLEPVQEAIYAAYGCGWEDTAGADSRRKGLTEEAIYLGRLLLRLIPGEPEAQGLLALMLHLEARREARRTASGEYIPLSEQDTTRWSKAMIEEAECHLTQAAQANRIGRFQLEAAIQSVHAERAWTGSTRWEAIALLYEGLVQLAPTMGLLTGRAAAVAEVRGAAQGLALLDSISRPAVLAYQPYWAIAAHLFRRLGRYEEARDAYSRAAGLSPDPAIREFLLRKSSEISPTID